MSGWRKSHYNFIMHMFMGNNYNNNKLYDHAGIINHCNTELQLHPYVSQASSTTSSTCITQEIILYSPPTAPTDSRILANLSNTSNERAIRFPASINISIMKLIKNLLTCPITCNSIKDPVMTSGGDTYEHVAIQKWMCKKKHHQ